MHNTREPLSRCCDAPKGETDRCPDCHEMSTFELPERRGYTKPYHGTERRLSDEIRDTIEHHEAYAERHRATAAELLDGGLTLAGLVGIVAMVYGLLYLL